MSSKRSLLVLVLLFGLFSVVGATQACCGEVPNYYMTVSIVGQPDCDYARGTGRVNWTINYHLPPNHNTFVYSYGDGVDQGSDFYDDLPHTPGYSVDTFSDHTIWTWQSPLPRLNSYKVRVQFEVHHGGEDLDWALIVFDCTAHGATNVVVHNG